MCGILFDKYGEQWEREEVAETAAKEAVKLNS